MSNPEELHESADSLEIIEFYIDEVLEDGSTYRSYYGMNVAKVLEIIRMPDVCELPGAQHEAILGTFNLRKRVLPLIDLGKWLDRKTPSSENEKVIVTEFAGIISAFVVTGVTRIHRITWAQVEPPGKYLRTFSHDSVTGLMRIENRILFLLDMEFVISTINPSIDLSYRGEMDEPTDAGLGYHVLVVDDSLSVRKTITHCLEREKFGITTATCGTEGLQQLREWEALAQENGEPLTKYVNLVISDIEMPEMDGHTFTAKIKNDPVLKQLPVILFSSIIIDVMRVKGEKVGADDQVSKPDLPSLARRTKDLIEAYKNK